MRSVKIACISLCILVGGCLTYTWYVNRLSRQMISHMDRLSYSITNQSWANIDKELAEFWEFYTPVEVKLYPLVNHEQISSMNTQLYALEKYIAARDRGDALAYCAMLKFQFLNIPQDEPLSWGNLL